MVWDFKERRDFDRVPIPATASLFLDDEEGNRIGRVTVLSRGGFLLETSRRFPAAEPLLFVLVGERDGVRRVVTVVQRYTSAEGDVGFEFDSLDPEAAIEIALLIRKYYFVSGAAK